MSDPSGSNRAETADKIARQFGDGALTDRERGLAEDIFRLLARDMEIRVRQTLSLCLKECSDLSRDIALTLAHDVDEVALPLLESSSVLTDEDLVEIVRLNSESKMTAIARRDGVSEIVSGELVEHGTEAVVSTLISNETARVGDDTLEQVVDRFGESGQIQDRLVSFARLPSTVAEKLATKISANFQEALLSRSDISPNTAAWLVLQTWEKTVLSVSSEDTDSQFERLIHQLMNTNRMTPSLVFRSLCMGNVKFFEHALAALSGMPLNVACPMVHDQGERGFRKIYEASGLPDRFMHAMYAAINVVSEIELDGREDDQKRFSRRMLERILTQYSANGVELEDEDLDYLLDKMQQFPSDITLSRTSGSPVYRS
ncbi:DUF2336 domain-containing protein [Phaeovibrio sulfidiphilus]|uniref:DUF2336 domain-containing protein n=1 Tax=Phaeovibrio sulfidiphilus TaxID=1220600 RepID=UPI001F552DC7|nr:DUF2336 domain-containing protein [Phaeovibrio sulfidiphilus]